MNKLFLLIVMIAAIGCQQSRASKPQDVTVLSSQQPVVIEQPTVQLESIDSCLPALYPDTWLDTVMAHPKIARFNADDHCVLSTIYMLEAMIISDTCERCMAVFNAVVDVSDGYVGEAVTEVAGHLYYQAFEPLIKSLADSTNKSREELLHCVAWSFYYELVGKGKDKGKQHRDEIIGDIRKKMLDKRRTEAERHVLGQLEKKVTEIIHQEYGY